MNDVLKDAALATRHTYKIETYAIIDNVDESILLLNNLIGHYGYQVVVFNLSELEEKFSDLFLLPKEFTSNTKVQWKEGYEITNEFYNAIQHNPFFGMELLHKRKLFLLKKLQDIEVNEFNSASAFALSFHYAAEINKFTHSLIQQLRLLTPGPVSNTIQFQISIPSKNITTRFSSRFARSRSLNAFTLTEEETKLLETRFSNELVINKLSELAVQSFNLSYEATDIKSKYLLLMTCLESIFNLGRDQIAHTVSRHLAIILSRSVLEFKEHYRSLKQLYSVRSTIVHGNNADKGLPELTLTLENYVRSAINYCLQSKMNRTELFDHLNTSGYILPDNL